MRDLGFDAVVNLSLADPGLPGRLLLGKGDPRGDADPRLEPPLARAVGAADHAALLPARHGAVQRGPRRRARRRVRVGARVPGKGAIGGGRRARRRVRGRTQATRFRATLHRGPRPGPPRTSELGDGGPFGRLLRAQGRPRGAGGSARGGARGRARGAALPASRAGRPACGSAAWKRDGSARSTRSFAASGTSMRLLGSKSRSRSWWRHRPSAWSATRTSPNTRPFFRTWRSRSRRGWRRPGTGGRGGGRRGAARSATVFDLYRGEQVGEGRKSLALRLEFRARIAPSPTPRSPSAARRSRRRCGDRRVAP